jgi:5-formyltetrahydrofolate cyclo-ligase
MLINPAYEGTPVVTKQFLRAQLRAARAMMDDGVRSAAASGLASGGLGWADSLDPAPAEGTLLPGPGICSYLPVGAEPDPRPLNRALAGAGYTVLVPVCEPEFRLSWAVWTDGQSLVRSSLAPVDEPAGPRFGSSVVAGVRGILLPALAADADGNRLGQGAGYYDRFLASLAGSGHAPATAAVVYDGEFLAAGLIETGRWDVPVSGVLTPGGYHAGRPGA